MPSAQDYRRTQIMTASPMQLILMLYDEAIRSLTAAEKAFDQQVEPTARFEAINNNLLHAQDIITELALSLDMEKGGNIAGNLQRLYEFMVHHLSEANTKKERSPVAGAPLYTRTSRSRSSYTSRQDSTSNLGRIITKSSTARMYSSL